MTLTYIILAAAFVSLVLGLGLYLWIARRSDTPYFNTTNLICWLLIGLFPVLLLFAFFPQDSEVSGTLFGFSATGAAALFLFIWWFGAKQALKAADVDARIAQKDDTIRKLEHQLQQAAAPAVRQPKRLTQPRTFSCRLVKRKQRRLALFAGPLDQVHNVDVWVNSENTNMQMARFFERSVSAAIRYLAAKQDAAGDVTDDVVADELRAKMKALGKYAVQPGAVLETSAGELTRTHGVKRLLHVASVQAQRGEDYVPVADIEGCLTKVLKAAESLADCKSILVPLFGTGTARADLAPTVERLIRAAIVHLETSKGPIEIVYFLVGTDVALETCRKILDESKSVEPE